jgi:hypothetical protein
MPMRNITVLMTANMAPAMPPPPRIFDTLICGFEASSLMLHLLLLGYHKFSLQKFPDLPYVIGNPLPSQPANHSADDLSLEEALPGWAHQRTYRGPPSRAKTDGDHGQTPSQGFGSHTEPTEGRVHPLAGS